MNWIKLGEKLDRQDIARRKADLRRKLGVHRGCRIEETATVTEPCIFGTGYHWTTRGGSPIRHPSAYARSGWSNMVYHASTIRIEVPVGYFTR